MNLKLEMIKMLHAFIPGIPQGFMLLFHRNNLPIHLYSKTMCYIWVLDCANTCPWRSKPW